MFKLTRLLFNGQSVLLHNRRCPILVTSHFSMHATKIPFNEQKDSENNEGEEDLKTSWIRFFRLGILFGLGYFSFTERKRLVPSVKASRKDRFNFIADVVEKTAAAVVNIGLVDRKLGFLPSNPQPRFSGSGFIIKDDGLILTNAHVVMGKESVIFVKLYDGSTYPGIVEDLDMKGDLATVRIRAGHKLPVLRLGTSSNLRPGEFVVAMGSPLSLSNTATSGIISRAQRKSSELNIKGEEMDYIQTDAAVTFGNSGGPLVDMDGEVIGINSMKVTAGISFAIPIDYAKEFLKQNEDRRRGIVPKNLENPKRYMGITMLSLTPQIISELRARYKLIPEEINSGVLVWKVLAGSPAHLAGLMPGDIVVQLNGEKVEGAVTVYKALDTRSLLTMKAFRMGTYHIFKVSPEVS